MGKPTVVIYVQPEMKSTDILTNFISKNIDRINHHLTVRIVKVTPRNAKIVKQSGVDRTPTLVYDGRKFVTLEKIVRILTPPELNQDSYGYGNTSSDELIHKYQDAILDTGDEDDEMDPGKRGEVLRQRMAALQKRRPQMEGVDKTRQLRGGRKVTAKPPPKSRFDTDDDFRKATRIDNIEDTPTKNDYMDDADGARLLEDYFNDEADRSGRKVGKVISKRR